MPEPVIAHGAGTPAPLTIIPSVAPPAAILRRAIRVRTLPVTEEVWERRRARIAVEVIRPNSC